MKKPSLISFDEKVHKALFQSIELAYKAIRHLYGISTKHTLTQNAQNHIFPIHKGFSVLKEIELSDPLMQSGISLLRDHLSEMQAQELDGSCLMVILAWGLVQRSIQALSSGIDPMTLEKSLENAFHKITLELENASFQISTEKELGSVSLTTSNGDQEIANYIQRAFEQVGVDGFVLTAASDENNTYLETASGITLQTELFSPYFMTSTSHNECNLEHPFLLIVDDAILSSQQILTLLQQIKETKRPLLIIANEISPEVLSTLTMNKLQQIIEVAAIRACYLEEITSELLEDLAFFSGATVISSERGLKLDCVDLSHLGQVQKALVGNGQTSFLGAKPQKDLLTKRLEYLSDLKQNETDPQKKESLNMRIAWLKKQFCILYPKKITHQSMEETFQSYEASLKACYNALESGVLANSAFSLYHISKKLYNKPSSNTDSWGESIFSYALGNPAKLLLDNRGLYDEDILRKASDAGEEYGVNLLTQTIAPLKREHIFDPLSTTLSALKQALSLSLMILKTNVMIVY